MIVSAKEPMCLGSYTPSTCPSHLWDAHPALSQCLPPGELAMELHWEVIQAWWTSALSQKALNASEGPHHVRVTTVLLGDGETPW